MFKLNKFATAFGVLTAVATLAACQKPAAPQTAAPAAKTDVAAPVGAKPGTGKKIGLAAPNLQAEYFNMIKQSVEAYGKEQGYEIIIADAKGDATTQVNQIQDMITQKVDALIYIPAGATAASVPVKAARAAGIPVINVDRNADGAPGDTFIHGENINSTKQLAELVCKLSGGKGNAVVIHGQKGTTPEVERMKGWEEGLKACPDVKITNNAWTDDWSSAQGNKYAQDMLQKDPSVSIIFGQADAIALGAAQAVKLAGKTGQIIVVGYDGDIGGLKAVQSGDFAATVTQSTFAMGRKAVDAATTLIAKGTVPADQTSSAELTTKDNVEKFLKDHP